MLAFARFCSHVRGVNTDMCQILRKYDSKSRAVHSCAALYDNIVRVELATCVMAESRTLYRMCSKADTYAAHETCMDLSITMYLRPSLAAADSPQMVNVFSSLRPAKLRSSQGVMYSAGRVGARGVGALIGAGRTPERACGTLGRSLGHGLGVFAG